MEKLSQVWNLAPPSSQGFVWFLKALGFRWGQEESTPSLRDEGVHGRPESGDSGSKQGGRHLRKPALPTPYPVAFSQMGLVGSGVSCGQQAEGREGGLARSQLRPSMWNLGACVLPVPETPTHSQISISGGPTHLVWPIDNFYTQHSLLLQDLRVPIS